MASSPESEVPNIDCKPSAILGFVCKALAIDSFTRSGPESTRSFTKAWIGPLRSMSSTVARGADKFVVVRCGNADFEVWGCVKSGLNEVSSCDDRSEECNEVDGMDLDDCKGSRPETLNSFWGPLFDGLEVEWVGSLF